MKKQKIFTKLKNFDSTEKIDNWFKFRGFLVALILIFAIEISFYGTFFLQKFDSFSFLICAICLYLFYLWDKREKLKDKERFFLRNINLYLGDKISLHLKKREKDGELIELGIDGFKMKLDDDSIFSAPWSTLKDNKFDFIRSKEDKKSVETVQIFCYLDSENNDFLEFYDRLIFLKKIEVNERLKFHKRLKEKIKNDFSSRQFPNP